MNTKLLNLIFGVIIILFYSCNGTQKNEDKTVSTIQPQLDEYNPTLKIILVDASGSFLKAHSTEKDLNLFDVSCEQIISEHLSSSKVGEHIIVRAIQSNSYGTNSLICDIDFSNKELNFDKPKPNEAGDLVNWKRELKKHNKKIQPKLDSIRKNEIAKFQTFYNNCKIKGSSSTDLCGALANIPEDLQQINSKFNQKILLIYSDLQNTTDLKRCNTFDANGLIINAFYVSDENKDPNEYKAFKDNVITTYFKNAKEINLFNPVHSKSK